MRTYKVTAVTQDRTLAFDLQPAELEKILNDHAKEGWAFDREIEGKSQFRGKAQLWLVFCREQ